MVLGKFLNRSYQTQIQLKINEPFVNIQQIKPSDRKEIVYTIQIQKNPELTELKIGLSGKLHQINSIKTKCWDQ